MLPARTGSLPRSPTQVAGTSLIEVLVSMVISVIGLLGLANFQLRTFAAEAESFQRTHAAVLLDDIVNRISANRTHAADYLAADIGVGDVVDCTVAATTAAVDLCEWGNLLRGSTETIDSSRVGAATAARGCIIQTAPRTYVVAVVWEGIAPTAAPATVCGKDNYSAENLRRAVTAIVSVADLG